MISGPPALESDGVVSVQEGEQVGLGRSDFSASSACDGRNNPVVESRDTGAC